jgi:hypothetical protein
MALVCLLSRLRALRRRIITASRFSMRTRDSVRVCEKGWLGWGAVVMVVVGGAGAGEQEREWRY